MWRPRCIPPIRPVELFNLPILFLLQDLLFFFLFLLLPFDLTVKELYDVCPLAIMLTCFATIMLSAPGEL